MSGPGCVVERLGHWDLGHEMKVLERREASAPLEQCTACIPASRPNPEDEG